MFEFVTQHQFWIAVVAYWVFSAAISSLPEPSPNGSLRYLWLYRFLHTIAGNVTTAFGGRIPGLKALFPLLLFVPFVLVTTACAAHYTVHPGALNTTDSALANAIETLKREEVKTMKRALIIDLMELAVSLADTYLDGGDVAHILLAIVQKGVQA